MSEAAILTQHEEDQSVREIVVGEYVLDADTGEILRPYIAEGFSVKDEASFDWVMKKILDAETDVNARQMKHNFVLEEMKSEMKRAKSRVEWLKARFGPELEVYAKKVIEEEQAKKPGRKVAKTVKSLFGKVSFRSVPGGLRVRDESKALEWAKKFFPAAVKVEEVFRVSLLTEDERLKIEVGLTSPPSESEVAVLTKKAFEIQPDEEKFDIKTGGSK